MGKFIITEEEKRHIKSLYEQEVNNSTMSSQKIDKDYLQKNPKGTAKSSNRRITMLNGISVNPNDSIFAYIYANDLNNKQCVNGEQEWTYTADPGVLRIKNTKDDSCVTFCYF
jgi:hypothetical protein